MTVGCSFWVSCCKPRSFALDVAVGAPKGRACSMLPCPPEAARVEEQPVGAAARRGGVRAALLSEGAKACHGVAKGGAKGDVTVGCSFCVNCCKPVGISRSLR